MEQPAGVVSDAPKSHVLKMASLSDALNLQVSCVFLNVYSLLEYTYDNTRKI